jgi:hypothetical protein
MIFIDFFSPFPQLIFQLTLPTCTTGESAASCGSADQFLSLSPTRPRPAAMDTDASTADDSVADIDDAADEETDDDG